MYETLAGYYDLFMADTPYEKWADRTVRLIGNRRRGVDVGCGTGSFTVALKKRGLNVTGMDISPEMLSLAAEKARRARLDISFVQGDMRGFTLPGSVEFVTAVCDAVNYLKEPLGFFGSAYDALDLKGMLLFDISSEYKLKNVLKNNTFSETSGDVTYIWQNFPGRLSKRCKPNKPSKPETEAAEKRGGKEFVDMELTFFERMPNGCYRKSFETQRQYVHGSEELKALLKEAGFKKVNVTKLSGTKPGEEDQRIYFAAYK